MGVEGVDPGAMSGFSAADVFRDHAEGDSQASISVDGEVSSPVSAGEVLTELGSGIDAGTQELHSPVGPDARFQSAAAGDQVPGSVA